MRLGFPMDHTKLQDKIVEKKEQINAVILAHNYQLPEIQDIADSVGDSLELAVQAMHTSADVIVFCGVDFMAESAKILNPNKTVIIPDVEAKCPMAGMVDPESLSWMKKDHPNAEVVTYVNSSAEVKALSDICCTSSNGAKVVKSIKTQEIIFVPDYNLGSYVQRLVPGKNLTLWPGICPTHHHISKQKLLQMKKKYPDAELLVHPECTLDVIDIADYTFSTNGMVNHVKTSSSNEFIIGTEKELCYRLQKENPNKEFYPVHTAVCPAMKCITLEKILNSVEAMEPTITLTEEILQKARQPLERMIAIGRGD